MITDGEYKNVGQDDTSTEDNITLYKDSIFWHGHSAPPLDRMLKENRVVQPNIIIHATLMVLAFLGLIIAFTFLFVNNKYSNQRWAIRKFIAFINQR